MKYCRQTGKKCYRTFCMMFSFKCILVPYSGYEMHEYCKAKQMYEGD